MFERGWEQYVGTGIYFWAVLTLSRELWRLWRNEQAFDEAPALLKRVGASLGSSGARPATVTAASGSDDDERILPTRVRQLAGYLKESRSPSVTQLMEVNREGSGLDQEHMAGRFTLTRYILYLLPVIGFIGTVEGISRALMNISKVLPMVKNLDGFLTNLTSVTAALQIAFDSTLLALFLSAALMLVQTLVFRRSEDLLARIDRWVVEHVLPRVGTGDPVADRVIDALEPQFEKLGNRLAVVIEPAVKALEAQAAKLGASLQGPIVRFAAEVERLTESLAAFQAGADRISRIGADLEAIGSASESLRVGVAALLRMQVLLEELPSPRPELEEIKRGVDRTGVAIESLSGSFSAAYERSSRATQEQLAHSLTSLKDALELLNVSMEQGNALYRNIVKKLFDERAEGSRERGESIRVA
jgi:biopolymer transport protein ExbB/TolQ